MRHLCVTVMAVVLASGASSADSLWPITYTDLSERERLTFIVMGDAGTGETGQYRVGLAMLDVCRQRACDFAIMVGDNIYDDGIEVRSRDSVEASLAEILSQFDLKFERPYAGFQELPGFLFWGVLGNHDYRDNAVGTMLTYSAYSDLWRVPAFHYAVPGLPDWIQIYGLHTDTVEGRDLNGLQVEVARRALCEPEPAGRWKMAFGHNPVYNSGHHRNDGNERRTRTLIMDPLLRTCGVHVYFSGHAHHQEHLTAPGFEQVIQGAAARLTGSSNPVDAPNVVQHVFREEFGFAIIEVDPERVRMDFYEVHNTEQDEDEVRVPTPAEIVVGYSWCGSQDDIGHPERAPVPCGALPTAEPE